MANKESLLIVDHVPIVPNLSLKISTVGEVLRNEQAYYQLTSSLTASPFSYMVQLDDMGIDYTTITEWELFVHIFRGYVAQLQPYDKTIRELADVLAIIQDKQSVEYLEHQEKLSAITSARYSLWEQLGLNLLFDDMNLGEFETYVGQDKDDIQLYNPISKVIIDKQVYTDIAQVIRKINLYEHIKSKPGNESAKKYLLEKERRKLKRNARKPYKSYLENMVVALVNNRDFPYDYDECMDLSIYRFNQSLKQIQHKTVFDNTMIGVYAGTINTSKMTNKECLSWIQTK